MGLIVSNKKHSLHSDTIITILFPKLNLTSSNL